DSLERPGRAIYAVAGTALPVLNEEDKRRLLADRAERGLRRNGPGPAGPPRTCAGREREDACDRCGRDDPAPAHFPSESSSLAEHCLSSGKSTAPSPSLSLPSEHCGVDCGFGSGLSLSSLEPSQPGSFPSI